MSVKNYVITIARGFGSGGKALGIRLAEELGITCYENRILVLASQITGKETAELIEVDEKLRPGVFQTLLRKLPTRTEPTAVEKKFESDKAIFQCQCKIIEELAETESCIIIGKCADYILKDRENICSLYIEAPRRYCLNRITERLKVDEKEAAHLIEKTDQYRADYYAYYTEGQNWTNPVNYDMTFNMERVGEEHAVSVIKDYLMLKFGEIAVRGSKRSNSNMYSFVKTISG